MKLYLLRKESSKLGKAMLFCRDRPWARILENPRERRHLPDGTYRLQWGYGEKYGWHISLLDGNGRRVRRILPLAGGRKVPEKVLSPVASFKKAAHFSRLEFLQLMERFQTYRAEDWYLEIETTSQIGRRPCG
jgi:hypothetical protein